MKAIVIAVIAVLGTSLSAGADFAEDFQKAKSLLKGKEYPAAHQAFLELAASAPNQRGKAASLSYAAIALGRGDQYEKAIELAQSIEAKPMAAYTQMTIMAQNRKHKELAAAFKEENIAVWPDDINYQGFFMRGTARNSAGDRSGAIDDFQQCVSLAGSDSWRKFEAMENAAALYHVLGDDAKAMALYRQALAFYEEEPGRKGRWLYPHTMLGAARILTSQKKYDDALALLKQFGDTSEAGKRDVWGFLVLEACGDVYAAQGKKRLALERYLDALSINTHKGYIDRVEKKVADL